jgi:hypothetical protein
MADGWIVRQAARRAGITKNVGPHMADPEPRQAEL